MEGGKKGGGGARAATIAMTFSKDIGWYLSCPKTVCILLFFFPILNVDNILVFEYHQEVEAVLPLGRRRQVEGYLEGTHEIEFLVSGKRW